MNAAPKKVFLGRQPILDRRQSVFGYELLFRSADVEYADLDGTSGADSRVVCSFLSDFGIREVLGGHKGFINVAGNLLMSDLVELLPAGKTVLEILETVELDDALLSRCRELKARGFMLALDDHLFRTEWEPFYEIVDIVKIDVLQLSLESLRETAGLLADRGPILLAEKVETMEQYRNCLDLGFELFQGYYFARPSVLNRRRVDVSAAAILRLLGLVFGEAELEEIEEVFKHQPSLSYNLLRLVNSVAVGTREKIRTLRHALVVLGMRQLRRWLQLALFAADRTSGAGSPLLETAAARGRLMEILAAKNSHAFRGRVCSDTAFMTGVLSLVDVLLELTMEEILDQLNLSEDVRLALLERRGPLGDLLLLTERLESLDFREAARLLERLHCGTDLLLEAQMEALEWTKGLEEIF